MALTTQDAFMNAEKGIDRASKAAGDKWITEATSKLKTLLEENPSFFCDEIWDSGLERGNSPRALGRVIQNAVKEGWMEEIKHENGIVAKPSKSSNNQLKRVWRSNIYTGWDDVPEYTPEPKKPIVIEDDPQMVLFDPHPNKSEPNSLVDCIQAIEEELKLTATNNDISNKNSIILLCILLIGGAGLAFVSPIASFLIISLLSVAILTKVK